MKRLFLFLTIYIFNFSPVLAGEVQVPPNQAKLEINGAVCAYCAYGMQKGLSKMECVDQTQGHKGVESDIENQIITIYLKEGETMNLKEMSDSIRKSGYEPRTFHLRVEGSTVMDGERMFLSNKNKQKLFELTGGVSKQLQGQQRYDLQLIIKEGAIKALKKDQPPVAEVHSIIKG